MTGPSQDTPDRKGSGSFRRANQHALITPIKQVGGPLLGLQTAETVGSQREAIAILCLLLLLT
jgi:hypothetical protein